MDGDAMARFEGLFEREFDTVLRYALARIDPDSAKDIASEVFLAAWRRLDSVPDPPTGWLIAVARNKVIDQYRASGRRDALSAALEFEPVAPDARTHDPADGITTRQLVQAAFRQLAPADQEVLRLVAWDDLDRTAAAQALGCTPALFAVRLHRARRRLRNLLGDTDTPTDPPTDADALPSLIAEVLR